MCGEPTTTETMTDESLKADEKNLEQAIQKPIYGKSLYTVLEDASTEDRKILSKYHKLKLTHVADHVLELLKTLEIGRAHV